MSEASHSYQIWFKYETGQQTRLTFGGGIVEDKEEKVNSISSSVVFRVLGIAPSITQLDASVLSEWNDIKLEETISTTAFLFTNVLRGPSVSGNTTTLVQSAQWLHGAEKIFTKELLQVPIIFLIDQCDSLMLPQQCQLEPNAVLAQKKPEETRYSNMTIGSSAKMWGVPASWKFSGMVVFDGMKYRLVWSKPFKKHLMIIICGDPVSLSGDLTFISYHNLTNGR
ncbi:8024_t:CDS:2 [Funneliformis mosseae]|uniref:8024_t:CDS:1 n=1 Tax=Funneliformis mosseae TaxID=27381 RepID=A0A9N9FE60_FUNMO|nr:8024_t:CDS:2 [Funneliformis mosseae]